MRVLPALRLQGSTGVGRVPGHGPRRDTQAAEADGCLREPGGRGCRLDRRPTRSRLQRRVKSDLRQMSVEAQSQMFAAPEVIGAAYAEILTPLVEQLERGGQLGRFTDVDPAAQRPVRSRVCCGPVSKGNGPPAIAIVPNVRRSVLQFCLRGSASPRRPSRRSSPRTPPTSPRRGTTDSGRTWIWAWRLGGGRHRRQQGHGPGDCRNPCGGGRPRRGDGQESGGTRRGRGVVAVRRCAGRGRHQRRHDRRRLHRRGLRHRVTSDGAS